MMEKYRKLTFMSWEESEHFGTNDVIRAVAPCDRCDEYGYFYAAINAMRDGDMGAKGKDGVYERIWWADSIGVVSGLRPASNEEVFRFLAHCDLCSTMDVYGEEVVAIIYGDSRVDLLVRRKRPAWWKRVLTKLGLRKKDVLPF